MLVIAAAAALSAFAPCARAQLITDKVPEVAEGMDKISSKLGQVIPLDLMFTNGEGKRVALKDFFRPKRPVVIALAYYRCPMTCPLVLSKLQQGLNGLPYIVGEDFATLVISFDPSETAKTAAEQKSLYLGGYLKGVTPVVKAGWEFLVSPDSSAAALASSVGFPYKYIPETGEYSHGAALVVLTPEGKVARYVPGLEYTSQDLRLALLEASEGKIASSIGDWFLHTCFRYDPTLGRYTVHAWTLMRIGAILTALGLGALIMGLRASERLKRYRQAMKAKAAELSTASRLPAIPPFQNSIGQPR